MDILETNVQGAFLTMSFSSFSPEDGAPKRQYEWPALYEWFILCIVCSSLFVCPMSPALIGIAVPDTKRVPKSGPTHGNDSEGLRGLLLLLWR